MRIDARSRTVTQGGRSTVLQEKTWQVLSLLIARAPEVVTRRDIIARVWADNRETGEKGLNQAVWAIRGALGDDPRSSRYIRTVPRVGYRWLDAGSSCGETDAKESARHIVLEAAGVSALVVMIAAAGLLATSSLDRDTDAPIAPTDLVATKAYLVDRDIHVEFANGCRRILKNASRSRIGTPVLSADGAHVAVTLHEDSDCRLVTVELVTGERRVYGRCPAELI